MSNGTDDKHPAYFIDWQKPFLPEVAAWLLDRYGKDDVADLSLVTVVLPGNRANRRLLELLVVASGQRKLSLLPPRLVTAGQLPELFYQPVLPPAEGLQRALTWLHVLRNASEKSLEALLPNPPTKDDWASWQVLSVWISNLHSELLAEGLDFIAVAERGPKLPGFTDLARWKTLAQLQASYLQCLKTDGWSDPAQARLDALKQNNLEANGDFILAAVTDLHGIQINFLKQLQDKMETDIQVLIHAPQDMADHFDEWGGLIKEAWQSASINIPDESIHIVEAPNDQAQMTLQLIEQLKGAYAADEITIGLPDEEVLAPLTQKAKSAGLETRPANGTPMRRSGPFKFWDNVANHMQEPRFDTFAALLRHPDLEPHLTKGLDQLLPQPKENVSSPEPIDAVLQILDQYQRNHLPVGIPEQWQGRPAENGPLTLLKENLDLALQELNQDPQPFHAWATAFYQIAMRIYGHLTDSTEAQGQKDISDQRLAYAACKRIHEVLQQMRSLDGMWNEPVRATDALRLMLDQVSNETIALPANEDAIEILGWLELHLDDTPVLIVTGLNEGLVPSSVNADPFLPESFRRHLGLMDNADRYARDAYALSAMLACRPQSHFIAGRRTAQGDPLTPSRLLFCCPDKTLTKRVHDFFNAHAQTNDSSPNETPPDALQWNASRCGLRADEASHFVVPEPRPLLQPIQSLSVTAFRDYIACPYRFYLSHVLRLRDIADDAVEMDPLGFGNLAHNILEDFGKSAERHSVDKRLLKDLVSRLLQRRIQREFDSRPHPAVYLQFHQLAYRLEAFASWQASQNQAGWRILEVEMERRDQDAWILVDDEPFYLRGRIDRIDRNEHSGEIRILDYKTSEDGKPPDATHRKGRAKEWVDLQLPLYRHLLRGQKLQEPFSLGYIVLPKDSTQVEAKMASWSESELEQADEKAAEVVRGVRKEIFWPMAEKKPAFSERFGLICQD